MCRIGTRPTNFSLGWVRLPPSSCNPPAQHRLYKIWKGGNHSKGTHPDLDLIPRELELLKKSVNADHPTVDNLKSIIDVKANLTKSAIKDYVLNFRQCTLASVA